MFDEFPFGFIGFKRLRPQPADGGEDVGDRTATSRGYRAVCRLLPLLQVKFPTCECGPRRDSFSLGHTKDGHLGDRSTMQTQNLERLVNFAKCRVFGWEDAANDAQRQVVAAFIHGSQTPTPRSSASPVSLERQSVS